MTDIRLNINIPQELHQVLKVQATLRAETIKEYVVSAVREKLRTENIKNHIPNKKTLKALEASEKGEVETYASLEDLYKKLDL